MREEDGWLPGERDVGGVRSSPDDPAEGAHPAEPARRERRLARTLEDVSHLFLSTEGAGAGAAEQLPQSPAGPIGRENARLRRALADLTVDHLVVRDAAEKLKKLERENELLRRAVADLTLDNLILKDAARGNP
jgi:hypothetical protein